MKVGIDDCVVFVEARGVVGDVGEVGEVSVGVEGEVGFLDGGGGGGIAILSSTTFLLAGASAISVIDITGPFSSSTSICNTSADTEDLSGADRVSGASCSVLRGLDAMEGRLNHCRNSANVGGWR